MALKDYFNDNEAVNLIAKQSLVSASSEVESVEYLTEFIKDKNRYIPQVDYSDPKNFAFFGSAEEYYTQAIKHIRDQYPYDGSYKERMEWRNKATFIDLYFFDKRYPRTNGYVTIAPDGIGTMTESVSIKNYALAISRPEDYQYIYFKGGPNVDNIYSAAENREENLRYDLASTGLTVEFWAKVGSATPTSASNGTDTAILFDLWNGENDDSPGYGRFTIGLNNNAIDSNNSAWFIHAGSGSSGPRLQSGSAAVFNNYTLADLQDNQWHHYAFTGINSGSDIKFELYVDGAWKDESIVTGEAFERVTGSMLATLGASVAFPDYASSEPGTATSVAGRGYGIFSGSIDEFRFWKKRRTSKEIGRYYRSQVGGGTNTDDSNVDLGVYFKFNEGITANTTDDAIILDYSGRLSNGLYVGYTSAARSTGSAMVESNAAAYEWQDPIVKSGHPSVVNLLSTMEESGSLHDQTNNSYMYYTYPSHLIEEDEEGEGNLKILTHVMGTYFDTLHLQIGALKTLKTKTYVSSSHKPHPHSNRLLTSVGFVAPNIFVDADVLEQFGKRSETVLFEEDLHNIRNTIYQNIYNNIDYIYKSKGTVKSFRNLLRCYGIDQELVKFNLYANNATYELDTDYEGGSVKKNFADFNDTDRNHALIYQSGALEGLTTLTIPQTTECEVVFPRKLTEEQKGYYFFPNLSSSLFGAMASGSNVRGEFSVYAVRGEIGGKDVKFVLSSTFGYLTSSIYRNVYDNEKWTFSVKYEPLKEAGLAAGHSDLEYALRFTGVNTTAGQTINEFTVSASIDNTAIADVMDTDKRFYVGATYDTISGSVQEKTDVRVSSLRHWYTSLSTDELKAHARHPYNFGVHHPGESVSEGTEGVNVPRSKALAVAWDFQSASLPDSTGMFTISDISSGSLSEQSSYGDVGERTRQKNDAVGRYYLEGDTKAIDRDYVHAYRPRLPESLNSDDMIQIGEDSDKIFTKNTRPVDYYWSFEKSLSQTISEEIMGMFATIRDFNNLIGEPVNRYRPEYKELAYLRQLFFQGVETDIDFERFFEFYKWIDSSLNMMLEKLTPLSSNTSGKIRNIVESHILERPKVWYKFPSIGFKQGDIIGQTIGGGGSKVENWKYNHHPLDGDETSNILWWKDRAERNKVLSSADADLDEMREDLREIYITETTGSFPKKYDPASSQTYIGSTYALKKARPYKLQADVTEFQAKRKADPQLLDGQMKNDSSLVASVSDIVHRKEITDETVPSELRDSKEIDLVISGSGATDVLLPAKDLLPFSVVSSSVRTGYQAGFTYTIAIEGLHEDTYGTFNEPPMQGPFTEKFVGGHPARHTEIKGAPSDTIDDEAIERFKITIENNLTINNVGINAKNYYREGLAKRPVNTANIRYNTSTTNQIGNFRDDYEVVVTSGRSANNSWFVKNNGILSSSLQESTSVSGVIDFTLSERDEAKHVIVERFSSPGEAATMSRGYLDRASEEYSAYNQVNYRNLTVRQPLKTLLSAPCGQFGVDSTDATLASFHKVNRNPRTVIQWSASSDYNSGNVVSGTLEDNWYVQHAIPQDDRCFAWITGSMKSWSPSSVTQP
jgi:hypothetical protein